MLRRGVFTQAEIICFNLFWWTFFNRPIFTVISSGQDCSLCKSGVLYINLARCSSVSLSMKRDSVTLHSMCLPLWQRPGPVVIGPEWREKPICHIYPPLGSISKAASQEPPHKCLLAMTGSALESAATAHTLCREIISFQNLDSCLGLRVNLFIANSLAADSLVIRTIYCNKM